METPAIKNPKLVVFDVEGVITPKNRFFFEMGKTLGFTQLLKVLFFGLLYETGLIPLKVALRHIFKGAAGMNSEAMMQIAAKVPMVPEAKDVFDRLRSQGCKTALVSSGLPMAVVKLLGDKLGADYAFGFDVGVDGDVLTGEIWGDVIERKGKFQVLQKIMADECLKTDDCAVVGDDRNNASIFLRGTRKIAYNPDFVLRIKADSVVIGKMSKVLSAINGEPKHRGSLTWNDIFREGIHALGFFVPVVASLVGVQVAATSIFLILGLYLVSEFLRTE